MNKPTGSEEKARGLVPPYPDIHEEHSLEYQKGVTVKLALNELIWCYGPPAMCLEDADSLAAHVMDEILTGRWGKADQFGTVHPKAKRIDRRSDGESRQESQDGGNDSPLGRKREEGEAKEG